MTPRNIPSSAAIGPRDVLAAADRIRGWIRGVTLAPTDPGAFGAAKVSLAYEFNQHTGTFKARGAANLAVFHLEEGTMPEAGVVIASGGNAGLACAWAAKATGTKATVFVPGTAPTFKVSRIKDYGAKVLATGTEYAHALEASIEFAESSGALHSHAYDHPLIAAGAGTLALEILGQVPDVDTIVVAVGGGGLFAGTVAGLTGTDVAVVAVEPENCRTLNAAIEHGGPVDVPVDSIAADSLGARRVSQAAYEAVRSQNAISVLVSDASIVSARQFFWDDRRVVVEHGGAAALAALRSGAYSPRSGEHVVVVLCGANTDPIDLVAPVA
jgi:threonine dehydratase